MNAKTNKHYSYKGNRLQSSFAGKLWGVFINENGPMVFGKTEAKAVQDAKDLIDGTYKS